MGEPGDGEGPPDARTGAEELQFVVGLLDLSPRRHNRAQARGVDERELGEVDGDGRAGGLDERISQRRGVDDVELSVEPDEVPALVVGYIEREMRGGQGDSAPCSICHVFVASKLYRFRTKAARS